MNTNLIAGVDCGATKIMVQSGILCSISKKMIPGPINHEYNFSNHQDWDNNFLPVPISTQLSENLSNNINLTPQEIKQGNSIVETIRKSFQFINNHKIGLCFPGLKDDNGVTVMANGPRIPDFKKRIKEIDAIYNDSDCCVIGECHSTIGKLQDAKNCIYIGGGTGIADGIVINGEIIDFNIVRDMKRSWELLVQTGETVESCLSPAGMIERYNRSSGNKVSTILELSQQKDFIHVIKKAKEAFSVLINDRVQFFEQNNTGIQKIVIGQRLGSYLKNDDHKLGKTLQSCTTIPIEFSEDRRTAALGAAWSKACL